MSDLACPFCGDTDPVMDEVRPRVWAPVCNGCGCMGPIDTTIDAEQTPEQAMARWNARTP